MLTQVITKYLPINTVKALYPDKADDISTFFGTLFNKDYQTKRESEDPTFFRFQSFASDFVKDEKGMSVMEKGPKHTQEWDREGWTNHHKRIDNGTKLFGKYYRNLWD